MRTDAEVYYFNDRHSWVDRLHCTPETLKFSGNTLHATTQIGRVERRGIRIARLKLADVIGMGEEPFANANSRSPQGESPEGDDEVEVIIYSHLLWRYLFGWSAGSRMQGVSRKL